MESSFNDPPRTCKTLALLSLALLSQATLGQPVPLPDVSGPIAVTEDSYPQMSAARMQVVVDLDAVAYVEEEFFVSGTANVYDWREDGALDIINSGAPYTTRILVRRPADPARASGNVIVELVNNARRYDWPFLWPLSHEHFTARGDVWVGMTHFPAAADALKLFNPERYAALSFANPTPGAMCPNGRAMADNEDGLRWDMISQVGALMRSTVPGAPLAGFTVEQVYATTHYAELATYVNAVHPHARLADGSPVYDGYLLKTNDYPSRINQCETAPAEGDPRQITRDIDVPVIRMIAQGDVPLTHDKRREDSDEPGDRYREYEVAGAPHMDTIYYQHMPIAEDQQASGQIPYPWDWPLDYRCEPDMQLLEFPVMKYATNAAFANLDAWVRQGVPPPRAERLELIQDDSGVNFVNDAHGNALGGLRSPWLDVPTATWHANGTGPVTCQSLAWKEAFSWAQLEAVYGSAAAYTRSFNEAIERLTAERWLTPADAEVIRQEAVAP